MWGALLLENKGEGATHIKNLGLHWGPLHSLCGYFFICFFRFLLCCKNLRCASRFCMGGRELWGQQSQELARGAHEASASSGFRGTI